MRASIPFRAACVFNWPFSCEDPSPSRKPPRSSPLQLESFLSGSRLELGFPTALEYQGRRLSWVPKELAQFSTLSLLRQVPQ